MGLPLYIVNAFTRTTFGGNPAAVMPLDHWLPDETLLAIAAQHNLASTSSGGLHPGPRYNFAVMQHWPRRMC